MKNNERFSTYMALDGPHLDGLIGSAGMLRFDWPERKFYIQHYEGISAAHNVSLAPNGELALLGTLSLRGIYSGKIEICSSNPAMIISLIS